MGTCCGFSHEQHYIRACTPAVRIGNLHENCACSLPWLQVRAELAPWESQMGEVDARRKVAEGEAEVLSRRADEARKRLDKAVDDLQVGGSATNPQVASRQRTYTPAIMASALVHTSAAACRLPSLLQRSVPVRPSSWLRS